MLFVIDRIDRSLLRHDRQLESNVSRLIPNTSSFHASSLGSSACVSDSRLSYMQVRVTTEIVIVIIISLHVTLCKRGICHEHSAGHSVAILYCAEIC